MVESRCGAAGALYLKYRAAFGQTVKMFVKRQAQVTRNQSDYVYSVTRQRRDCASFKVVV